jgi:hypothetical protein
VNEPVLAQHVRARASYGPEVHAQAANLVSGHYLPVARAAQLLAQPPDLHTSTAVVQIIRRRQRFGAAVRPW